jgi:hypothetical protein
MRLFVVFLGLDICVNVPCAVYMVQLILMMLRDPWLTGQFVFSIAGQTGSSFVSSLRFIIMFTGAHHWCLS